ncbi:MAG: tetratricopeptide repeat protein [Planctomycetia bacterium]
MVRQPKNAPAHYHLGLVYQKQQRPDRARQLFQMAMELDPNAEWVGEIKTQLLGN